LSELLQRLWATPQGKIGSILVAIAVFVAAFGPAMARYDPEDFHNLARLSGPSFAFPLGTDQFGRDVLSRVLAGARPTLVGAVLATALATAVGSLLGTCTVFFGGAFDEILMRFIDALLAIPGLLLALLIVAVLGASPASAIIAIGMTSVPSMTRITRSAALAVHKQEFISAAVARGESAAYIIMAELLPNVVAPIIIEMTVRISFSIMLLSTLSFLGDGAEPPAPEWGLMIGGGQEYLFRAPWVLIAPSAGIAIVSTGFNLLGDGLRDALNPRT
jgi:peptide/nickel transport system permease protein